jgi:SHS family lactate transporter-like MFS transporter
MISVLWFAACDGGIAFAPTFKVVFILRTLFGLGMGAEWSAGTTMAMENWPKRSRGIASGVLQGSWAIGYLLASKVSGAMLNADGTNWRTLFLVAAAPALLVLPIRLWVPESLTAAKEEDAPPVVQAAAVTNEQSSTPEKKPLSAFAVLFLASLYTGVAFAAYYAFTTLYATFLGKELHLLPPDRAHLVVLFNIGMMVGSLGCGYLAAKWSPVGAILICSCTVFLVLPIYVGWAAGFLHVAPYTSLEIGAFLGGIFGAGFCGVTPLLLTSMFPAGVRARSIGIVYHVGACFAAFAPPLVTILVETYHLTYAQAIFASSGGFHLILGIALVFRPRGLFASSDAKAIEAEAQANALPVPEFH